MAELAAQPFDPNINEDGRGVEGGVAFPKLPALNVEDYAEIFTKAVDSYGSLETFVKALSAPPSSFAFARISSMPNNFDRGIAQPPGLPFEALRKIGRENLAPQMIINMRVDDVLRYSGVSSQPWKPGWRIEMREGLGRPTTDDLKQIREAERFMQNCNSETGWDARARDENHLTNFSQFLAELTRDSLTYDGMSIWTDMDLKGRVRAFKALPTFNMRLTPSGYNGDPAVMAVGLNEVGAVKYEFTRQNLTFYRRNPRVDADIFGYGYPEIEQATRLIQAFTNAFDLNADIFNKNAIPQGFLTATGLWTQRQLDVLSRIWANLKRGNSKAWALPVIPVPKDGKLEILDLSRLKDNSAYYQDFINMLAGAFCAIYRFPVERLHYRTSGRGPDTELSPTTTAASIIDEGDPGLPALLIHLETVLTEYILWTRYPTLQLRFQGKNPKEDARSYEAKLNAATYGERRAMADLPAMETLAKGADEKKLARLMDLCPSDPALAPIWQSLVTAQMQADAAQELQATMPDNRTGKPGARMTPKKDPARSEQHGHMSGVRRNTSQEKHKTPA